MCMSIKTMCNFKGDANPNSRPGGTNKNFLTELKLIILGFSLLVQNSCS